MICKDCHHWLSPRSVESLPDYPIGFCNIFQKDVAGEYAGCAGRFYLSRNQGEWHGSIHETEVVANLPIEVPEGAKIVSFTEPSQETNTIKVVYLIPDTKPRK